MIIINPSRSILIFFLSIIKTENKNVKYSWRTCRVLWSFHKIYFLSYLGLPLEKTMALHSSNLAWQIPWMEEPDGLQFMGSLRVGHNWAISLSLSCIGEGSGNPFQCSCLENPRDGGAWWAAVYGVAQSRTRLKWLSSSRASLVAQMVKNPLVILEMQET